MSKAEQLWLVEQVAKCGWTLEIVSKDKWVLTDPTGKAINYSFPPYIRGFVRGLLRGRKDTRQG